jgi:hypothetical protein
MGNWGLPAGRSFEAVPISCLYSYQADFCAKAELDRTISQVVDNLTEWPVHTLFALYC